MYSVFRTCPNRDVSELENEIVSQLPVTNNISDAGVWFPCGYNSADAEFNKIASQINHGNHGFIMSITGQDNLAAKNLLWEHLVTTYGRKRAMQIAPETWNMASLKDITDFVKNAPTNQNYILKKNVQRQTGLSVHDNKNSALMELMSTKGYAVAQKIVGNPFIINGRKINMRVYVLIVCKRNIKEYYIYNDSFIYYSAKPYGDGKSYDSIITTGYLDDRSFYKTAPLTHTEFYNYLGEVRSNILKARIRCLFSDVFACYKNSLKCAPDSNKIYCQVFGADIQPDANLNPIIIEINKSPSLQVMDEKDGALKRKFMSDLYKFLKIIPSTDCDGNKACDHNFINIKV